MAESIVPEQRRSTKDKNYVYPVWTTLQSANIYKIHGSIQPYLIMKKTIPHSLKTCTSQFVSMTELISEFNICKKYSSTNPEFVSDSPLLCNYV